MAKTSRNSKKRDTKVKTKNKQDEKYNAENEIIIGVTTKPKQVRVENKKSTRTNQANKKRTSLKDNNPIEQRKNNKNKKVKKIKKDTTKEKQIKKSNRKKIVVSLFILLIIILAGTIYFLTTPRFNIANIEISGESKNSVETYISLSKIEMDTTNIFAITKNSIIRNIKENPYVESVVVKRKLPNTIQINITERKIEYQAQCGDKYAYLDKQGYVLEINSEKREITKILGFETTKEPIEEGQRLKNEDLLKLDTVLKIVNYSNYNSIENKITSIDVSDVKNYTVHYGKEGQTAYLGNDTKLNEKILSLKNVLEKEKGNKGEIFVDENAINRNRVHFKPAGKKE